MATLTIRIEENWRREWRIGRKNIRPHSGTRVGSLRQKEREQRGKREPLSSQPLVSEIPLYPSATRNEVWKDEESSPECLCYVKQ